MAKTSVTDWDTTAANNTDINSIDIDENCAPSGINNAIREQMAQIATAMTTGGLSGISHQATASTHTVLEADRGGCFDCSAALTLNLTAAATMQAGWMCYVKADGGAVTIDPNSTEQIDGASTLVLPDGTTAIIYTDGSAWYSIKAADLLDEDDMATDSATQGATQQSIKAYVDGLTGNPVVDAKTNADSPYALLAADQGKLITLDSTSGTVEVDLLSAATAGEGFRVSFKRIAGSNTCTLDADGSETIDGSATYLVSSNNRVLSLRSDGTNWLIDGAHKELLDEDDMASNSSGQAPTQQSVKAYTGLAFLDAVTASTSADIEFDLPSGYRSYKIFGRAVRPATDAVQMLLRMSDDSGSTYFSGGSDYAYQYMYRNSAGSQSGANGVTTAIAMNTTQGNVTASERAEIEITISDPSDTGSYTRIWWQTSFATNAGAVFHLNGSGTLQDVSAIDNIAILYSSGNIDSGDFELYGVL